MILALVTGKAYSSHKHSTFDRMKTLLCQPLSLDLKPTGAPLLAVDSVGAGEGEVVLVIKEGRSARDFTGNPNAATRTMIVGIVDQVEINKEWLPQ